MAAGRIRSSFPLMVTPIIFRVPSPRRIPPAKAVRMQVPYSSPMIRIKVLFRIPRAMYML